MQIVIWVDSRKGIAKWSVMRVSGEFRRGRDAVSCQPEELGFQEEARLTWLNEEREQKWSFQEKGTGLEMARAQRYKTFCGAGAEE